VQGSLDVHLCIVETIAEDRVGGALPEMTPLCALRPMASSIYDLDGDGRICRSCVIAAI
jgi:hypothetical protein